jgi:chromosome segregation protein
VSKHDLQLSQLRGRAEAAEQKRATVAQEVARREQAVAQAETRAEEARQQLADFEAREEIGETPETGLDDAYRAAQERQGTREQQRDEARDRLHELEQERAGLEARVSALTRSLDQRDASGALLAEGLGGIDERISDRVRVREGYEAAVGAALGVFADALLAHTASAAETAVAVARERDLGRMRAIIAQNGSAPAADGPDISGLTRVSEVLLEAPDGVRGVLARSYIADELPDAVTAADELRARFPAAGFTIVTAHGDVLTEHTLSGGSGLAPSRIELTAELEQAEQRRTAVAERIAETEAELAELRAEASRAKTDAQQAYAELRAADARLAELSKERNRLSARAEAAQAEAERARQAIAAVADSAAEAAKEAERAAQAHAEAEAKPRPILDASQRDGLVAELERARAAEMEARLALETARERSRAGAAHRETLAEQFEAERRAAEETARRAVLRSRQVSQAERVAGLLPAILDACDRSLSEARLAQQHAEQERAKHSQELTLLRSEESGLRQKLQTLTERVHGAELKSYERKLQLSALLERSGNELGLVEDVLIAEYGPDVPIPVGRAEEPDAAAPEAAPEAAPDPEPQFANALEAELAAELGIAEEPPVERAERVETRDSRSPGETVPFVRAEQEKRLARAERQLTQLGRINPLALEEFAALEQRHRFLSEQLTDLSKTRSDLLSIIEELDRKMQGIFATAFEDTKAAFAEVFPILFPGGSGEIALSDPDDLLNTGIDMAVKPAGKKVERLSLLSGGVRSLAAVAWLIAIFQARPSPFYIMDEVEAALDDANLGRLLQVFERLRENSQLIVITHQKRTMEIADALYGVSMRQDGISAVVGQRIARDEA